MDYFLIVILGFLVFFVWQGSQNAVEQLRQEIRMMEREIGWLREQLAALAKAQAASAPQPTAAPVKEPVAPAALPIVAPVPAKEPAAEVRVTPTVASFTAPVEATRPALPEIPSFSIAAEAEPKPKAQPWLEVTPPAGPKSSSASAPPVSETAFAAAPATEPVEPSTASSEKLFSLEERLGANWLNKLGIASLVIGLAFFLALKLESWGPAGKVLCGYAVSLLLLAGGVWLERKSIYRIFARAGIGGGWALAFFTTFALYHVPAAHVLDSLAADLVLMLIVAAGMVGHSLLYRSQAVTGLAFLLGFATLLTSHLEAANGAFSLISSAVLALALIIVTTQRHWAELELAGLGAVYLTHFVWLNQVLPADHAAFAQFWPSTALILLYWLIFRLAYVLRTPGDAHEENLSSLAAVLNSTGVLGLLKFQSAHPEWAFWALLALGAVEMALAFFVRARRRQAFVVLSTIATVLLISAVPFKFHGVSWPVLWLVEAQVLAICGLRLGEPVFRRLGLLTGLVAGGVLAFHDVVPLLDLRLTAPDPVQHFSLTAGLALAAALYWIHAEIYPRRWPQIVEGELEALALRMTSWLAVGVAAAALWVALPELWLPVGWLALVLLLGFAARRFTAFRVALEADLLALAAAALLVFDRIGPLAFFRMDWPDPSRHVAETAVLALAALAYWAYAEIFPRFLPLHDSDADSVPSAWIALMLPVTSLLGTAMAASALWVVVPAEWVVVSWLALVLLLGFAADGLKATRQAFQADLLAMAATLGLFFWDLWSSGWWNHQAPLIAAVALLYAGMRRKTAPGGVFRHAASAYSWAATLLLAFTAVDISPFIYLTPVFAALGLALFEIGRWTRKGFLRWQGFFLAALAFGNYLIVNLPDSWDHFAHLQQKTLYADAFSFTNSLLLEVLVLAAAGFWLLERTRNAEHCTGRERLAGLAANALGTLSIALWFAYRFPSYWVPVPGGEVWVTAIWAAMATVLLALAWLLRRRAFLAQALGLATAVLGRAFFVDLWANTPPDFWQGTLFHLAVAALILLAALPFAFRLRGEGRFPPAPTPLVAELELLLGHPEQLFFFAAFALEFVALAAKLSSGHITIAWSLLGLAVFLFALVVGERSFRLSGLGLLLVSVAKILLMDVWQLSLSDRIATLVILGVVLMIVSFLYTRFGTVIRRFL
jgi:uncharacterized membrane protein